MKVFTIVAIAFCLFEVGHGGIISNDIKDLIDTFKANEKAQTPTRLHYISLQKQVTEQLRSIFNDSKSDLQSMISDLQNLVAETKNDISKQGNPNPECLQGEHDAVVTTINTYLQKGKVCEVAMAKDLFSVEKVLGGAAIKFFDAGVKNDKRIVACGDSVIVMSPVLFKKCLDKTLAPLEADLAVVDDQLTSAESAVSVLQSNFETCQENLVNDFQTALAGVFADFEACETS